MPITVRSGFWNDTYSFIDGRAPVERRIAMLMGRRGYRDVRELLLTLDGVVPGSVATEQYKRKTAVADPTSNVQGGVQAIETVSLVNRATVAGDVTQINASTLGYSSAPASYPVNKDGNPRGNAGG